MSKPTNGRYGQWAGNPNGKAEDPNRCVEECWRNGSWIQAQCMRERGHGLNGEYCRQHAKKIERVERATTRAVLTAEKG